MLRIFALFFCTIVLNHYLYSIKAERSSSTKEYTYQKFSEHSPTWYCGCAHVLADLQWLLLSHHTQELSPDLFYNYADYITNLDRHFNVVYRYALIHLVRTQQAVCAKTILNKAIRSPHNIDDWRLYLYGAYAAFFLENNKKQTQAFLQLAFTQPESFFELLKQDRVAPPLFLSRWHNKLKENQI